MSKIKPTQIDLEAFPLFALEPGMVFWASGIGWVRNLGHGDSYTPADRSFPDPHPSYWQQKALDTDDPATQGCLLAQLIMIFQPEPMGVAVGQNHVSIIMDGNKVLSEARTLGEALVKAMELAHKVRYRRQPKEAN